MVDVLGEIVNAESPSSDLDAVRGCADLVAKLGTEWLGAPPEIIETDGRPHLRWRGTGDVAVLLLAHLDTVWPLGTIDRKPFEVRDGVARGPGVFDMKAGLVQGLFALARVATPAGNLDGLELLVTSDEELGSPSSRELIEGSARRAGAVLVLEPSEAGALKLARKGVSLYEVHARGRASHSGLAPEDGANALVELAHQVLALEGIARGQTTVVPTTASAGTAKNTVPPLAQMTVDVRAWTRDEQARVDDEMKRLRPVVSGVELEIVGGPNRPPMERSATEVLFARANVVAERLGLVALDGCEVGGASDGNFTAGVGTPTLDGLGAVGGGAHAEDEHVIVNKMPERAALVAALISELLSVKH